MIKIPVTVKRTCSKCGRTFREADFYKMKNGERCDLCKSCLTQYIDNRRPDTFLWILEKFDVPYIEAKWAQLVNEIYKKDPGKFGPTSILGRYLRTMNMTQYKDYRYADTDMLNNKQKKVATVNEEYEAELLARLESGEISESEYNTLTATNVQETDYSGIDTDGKLKAVRPDLPTPNPNQTPWGDIELPETPTEPNLELEQGPQYQLDTNYWIDQLDDDDIHYLMLKWGTVYTPEQWIKMETMYAEYAKEYDLNVDREEVLKKMCKTSLKMDECLDAGDITAYKNLATVFDQLRKGAKFTEAQNKDDKQQEVLSSIGELVRLVEKEGGIIPNLPEFDPDQYPQDKIDFTIKDLKAYNYRLATEELGLGDLIESYIEKLEKVENQEMDMEAGLITSTEEAIQDDLTEDDIEEWDSFIENEVEAEAEAMAELMRGGF